MEPEPPICVFIMEGHGNTAFVFPQPEHEWASPTRAQFRRMPTLNMELWFRNVLRVYAPKTAPTHPRTMPGAELLLIGCPFSEKDGFFVLLVTTVSFDEHCAYG